MKILDLGCWWCEGVATKGESVVSLVLDVGRTWRVQG